MADKHTEIDKIYKKILIMLLDMKKDNAYWHKYNENDAKV